MITSIRKTISDKPWLLIVGAFVLLICMWTALIVVAVRHRPQPIPLSPALHESR